MKQIAAYKTFLLVFLLPTFSAWPIDAKSTPAKCNIGYSYSTAVLSLEQQENFLMGFKFGLREAYGQLGASDRPCASYDKINIIKVGITGTAMSPIKAANQLASKDVVLLAGFPSSHEALLAAKIAKEKSLPFIILGASANDLLKYSDFIFTISPKRDKYTEKLIRDFAEKYRNRTILVVAKKDNVFSMDIVRNLQRVNKETGFPLTLKTLFLDNNFQLDSRAIGQLDPSYIAAVYITNYPSESKSAFTQLLPL